MTTPTEDSRPALSPTVPMPRMRAVVDASLVVEVTSRPGVSRVRSLMSLTPLSCRSWWLTVVTTIGTSCRFWERFCAVTMISSTLVGAAADELSEAGRCGAGAALAVTCANADEVCNAMTSAVPDAKKRRWLLDCMIPPSHDSCRSQIENDCLSSKLDLPRPILRYASSFVDRKMIDD